MSEEYSCEPNSIFISTGEDYHFVTKEEDPENCCRFDDKTNILHLAFYQKDIKTTQQLELKLNPAVDSDKTTLVAFDNDIPVEYEWLSTAVAEITDDNYGAVYLGNVELTSSYASESTLSPRILIATTQYDYSADWAPDIANLGSNAFKTEVGNLLLSGTFLWSPTQESNKLYIYHEQGDRPLVTYNNDDESEEEYTHLKITLTKLN